MDSCVCLIIPKYKGDSGGPYEMNNKIDALIRDYKREKEPLNQLTIIGSIKSEIDRLSVEIAKKIK